MVTNFEFTTSNNYVFSCTVPYFPYVDRYTDTGYGYNRIAIAPLEFDGASAVCESLSHEVQKIVSENYIKKLTVYCDNDVVMIWYNPYVDVFVNEFGYGVEIETLKKSVQYVN